MPTFEEIKAKASLAETSVRLVLAGEHLEKIRQLEEQLRDAPPPSNLGERSPAVVYAEQIAELQEQMRDSEVEFHLRAMPGRVWDKYKFTQPIRTADETVEATADRFFDWMCRLVSDTCYDPKMTSEQVAELVDLMPGSSWDTLSDAAWTLNSGKVRVPFSVAAFALTSNSGETSRRPSGQGSRPAGSGAKNARKPPLTSTTSTDA